MSQGYQISKILKNVESDNFKERSHRALLLANALAFNVSLVGETVDSILEANLPELRKLASQINEHITLDVKVLENLFSKVVKIRFELLNGITDPTIIQMAMNSDTADLFLDSEESIVAKALVDKTNFYNMQCNLKELLSN